MRRRVLILIGLVFSLCSCGIPPMDLRYPICIVRDSKDSPPNWHREYELEGIIRNGINMWFKHIPDVAPAVLIMNPGEEDRCSNPDIRVKVVENIKDACAKINYNPAKYSGFIITLSTDCSMGSRYFAHEFGHAIWKFEHVLMRQSVMSPDSNFYVTPKDMEMMCYEHPEINCPKFVWCENTFYDKERCPGPSPDDTVILYKGMYGESWNGHQIL
jgi:hypothetical protein